MANGRIVFILESAGGELARHVVGSHDGDGEKASGDYTRALIDWLEREHIVLTEGDRIDIVWEEIK